MSQTIYGSIQNNWKTDLRERLEDIHARKLAEHNSLSREEAEKVLPLLFDLYGLHCAFTDPVTREYISDPSCDKEAWDYWDKVARESWTVYQRITNYIRNMAEGKDAYVNRYAKIFSGKYPGPRLTTVEIIAFEKVRSAYYRISRNIFLKDWLYSFWKHFDETGFNIKEAAKNMSETGQGHLFRVGKKWFKKEY